MKSQTPTVGVKRYDNVRNDENLKGEEMEETFAENLDKEFGRVGAIFEGCWPKRSKQLL